MEQQTIRKDDRIISLSYKKYFEVLKPSSQEWNEQFVKWLHKRYLEENGVKFILDLGAGNSELNIMLRKFNYGAISLDYPVVDLEKKLNSLIDNSFDCIILKFVIEHIQNINLLFSEIKRILRKGGLLIVLTDNYPRQIEWFYDDPTHKTPFTINRLKNLALLNDFEIVELRKWRNIPFIWRYTIKAFDYTYINNRQLLGVFKK